MNHDSIALFNLLPGFINLLLPFKYLVPVFSTSNSFFIRIYSSSFLKKKNKLRYHLESQGKHIRKKGDALQCQECLIF